MREARKVGIRNADRILHGINQRTQARSKHQRNARRKTVQSLYQCSGRRRDHAAPLPSTSASKP